MMSRYLPVLVYAKGAPDKAAYFGHRLENFQRDNNPFWTPVQQCNNSGSLDTMQKAIDHIRAAGIKTRGIGADMSASLRPSSIRPSRTCRSSQTPMPTKNPCPRAPGDEDARPAHGNSVSRGGVAGGLGFWEWIAAHPVETAAIALFAAAMVAAGLRALNRWHRSRQEAPTPNLMPVAV